MSTPARKNLKRRMFYNSEDQNFLNFKRSLPSSESSPSVPILKVSHIIDDAMSSRASKRKQVSFHDPPVTTTVFVEKYIEPGELRSHSSSQKRKDRPLTRQFTPSLRRLHLRHCSVKLTDLFNAASSTESLRNDSNSSMEVTPAVQIVKSSELNDADPICPELVDCKHSLKNVAVELSDLFIKKMAGKVDTVGDLARMTELEVNRMCIKAPKFEIVKKILNDYATKRAIDTEDVVLSKQIDEQTIQTDVLKTSDIDAQTTESSFMTTSDVITACLSEREDFVDKLIDKLDESTLRRIAEKMSTKALVDLLAARSEDFRTTDFKTVLLFFYQLLKA